MLLTIDVGNTNMVFGLLDGNKLAGSFRAVTNSDRTADELGLTVHTVRSHLKTIHAKVGVRSNMQLLQIVRAYCDA